MEKLINRLFVVLALLMVGSGVYAQKIVTVAGNSVEGYGGDLLKATAANLHWPQSLALDRKGRLYIADAQNNCIRMVGVTGVITTIVGTGYLSGTGGGDYFGDGAAATLAHLYNPTGIAIDTSGNLFIADQGNNVIRKVDTGGIIHTVAGTNVAGFTGDNTAATASRLNSPVRVAVDTFGNLYIADVQNNRVRKVDVTGTITTIAGTGTPTYTGDGNSASAATLNYPADVTVDRKGNIYIADELNNCIRKIDVSGIITTVAGTGIPAYTGDHGPATAARLYDPTAVAVDDSGNVYISDWGNSCVRELVVKSDTIFTIAGVYDSVGYKGDGGPATAAFLNQPQGITVNPKGSVYFADMGNNCIRFIGSKTEAVNVINYSLASVSIYPNPGQGSFIMNISSVFYEQAKVVITNIAGETVKETTVYTNTPHEIRLEAPPGLYLISETTAHGAWAGRLVVK